MIELHLPVSSELAQRLEDHFCEDYQEHWMLLENWKTREQELKGYFETREEAETAFATLRSEIEGLRGEPSFGVLEDRDWKEAYKFHFKPWSDRGLHWVPVWEKENYDLPAGEQIVYLDPGMAFGTGNHETTRLCVRRLLDCRDAWGKAVAEKNLIDAGCGSGILAISARKIGFTSVCGFDNDPDSVRISADNERLCGLDPSIEWKWADLREGLKDRQGDLLLANILSPVLVDHAALLVRSVAEGGELVLSGILAREAREVHKVFEKRLRQAGKSAPFDSRTDGDWADLRYRI